MSKIQDVSKALRVVIYGEQLVLLKDGQRIALDEIEWFDLRRWVNRNLENNVHESKLHRPIEEKPDEVVIPAPPCLILMREYKDDMKPFVVKRKLTTMWGVQHTRGSRLTTAAARFRHGGLEISIYSADPTGFDAALAELKESDPCKAHMAKLTEYISQHAMLVEWMKHQVSEKRAQRLA